MLFFVKQKTAYDMRISDWSSDVCSSDLWTSGAPALVEIVHDSTRQDSNIPVRRIENALQRYGQQVGALRLLARGINPAVAAPLSVAHKDLSTPEARRGMLMAILPYFLILSAFIGGAYQIGRAHV